MKDKVLQMVDGRRFCVKPLRPPLLASVLFGESELYRFTTLALKWDLSGRSLFPSTLIE